MRFEDFNIDRQYTDGPNLYQAVIGDPVSLMDPEGLAWYWPDWANEGFLWITGGSGYTYTDCVGDCIDHWNGWMDELVAALLAAENAVPAIGTGEIRNLNPVPRLTGGRSKIGSPSKNTTNWQNLWKELPSKFKTQKVLKLLKGLGRVNIALILADGAIAASIEAHCAGHCAGWSCGGGGRYDPDHDHWFSDD